MPKTISNPRGAGRKPALPEDKKQGVSIRLSPEILEKLKGKNKSRIIEDALNNYFDLLTLQPIVVNSIEKYPMFI